MSMFGGGQQASQPAQQTAQPQQTFQMPQSSGPGGGVATGPGQSPLMVQPQAQSQQQPTQSQQQPQQQPQQAQPTGSSSRKEAQAELRRRQQSTLGSGTLDLPTLVRNLVKNGVTGRRLGEAVNRFVPLLSAQGLQQYRNAGLQLRAEQEAQMGQFRNWEMNQGAPGSPAQSRVASQQRGDQRIGMEGQKTDAAANKEAIGEARGNLTQAQQTLNEARTRLATYQTSLAAQDNPDVKKQITDLQTEIAADITAVEEARKGYDAALKGGSARSSGRQRPHQKINLPRAKRPSRRSAATRCTMPRARSTPTRAVAIGPTRRTGTDGRPARMDRRAAPRA